MSNKKELAKRLSAFLEGAGIAALILAVVWTAGTFLVCLNLVAWWLDPHPGLAVVALGLDLALIGAFFIVLAWLIKPEKAQETMEEYYGADGTLIVAKGDMVDLAPLYRVEDIRKCPETGDIVVKVGSSSSHRSMWVMREECEQICRKATE